MRSDRRRKLLLASGALLAAPLACLAQGAQRVRRLAILNYDDPESRQSEWRQFHAQLREHGYSEGANLAIERRWAHGAADKLPGLAQELLAGKPEVIVCTSTSAARVLMRQTQDVAIVFLGPADPVATGLVASLARPGGNVTGVSGMLSAVNEKRLEMMREIVPGAKRIALLGPADNAGIQAVVKHAREVARPHGLEVRVLDASDAPSIARAFAQLREERVDALLVASILYPHRAQIVGLAARHRIPASYVDKESVEAGGLIALAPERDALYRHAADQVHRILQGARPAELPVIQPAEFWLGVNLRTARELGLTIPRSVLIRANHVVE
jgi:putative ABC transport system substrate-binding protein